MKLTGQNWSTRRKTCPSTTLSTTNPTWTEPGLNPRLRGGRPAANRLSHGTAVFGYDVKAVDKYNGYGKTSSLLLQGQMKDAALSSETSGSIDPFTWLHIPEDPNRTWHSDLTGTLLAMRLDWGTSCYEHILTLAVDQIRWSSDTHPSYSARRLHILKESSCFC
jgi:hypothetical protein